VYQVLSSPFYDVLTFHLGVTSTFCTIVKQNCNQFLSVVKATALKQQISKFYPQIPPPDASDDIHVSQWPVINVKATSVLRIESADKILVFAVLER